MAGTSSHIGKYEIVRPLGQGGMGAVYLARDAGLDRFVAIKVLREHLFDEELLERFFREARAAANLRHENIITIYDVGQHDQQPYMALEYVDGRTLFEIVRAETPLPLAQRLSYVEQICAGLHFAHAAGIVHRDIKPANVMVDRRGMVRILDFGIARVQGSGMTRDGAMIGTLNYMSPEQMLGRPVDFRSDIFAVGALAYELITYNKAFPGSIDEGLLHRLPHEQPPPLSTFCEGLPEELEAIVLRALAKHPQDRFANLDQMRLAVSAVRHRVDPELALQTIIVTGPRGAAGRPASSSGRSEHPEFAERRARQIAVHLEAARTALQRQDVEAATSACEDALTLAPDHTEALALLEAAQRIRQQRDEESRARRERERTVRQRVADADLRLARGDVEGAVVTLEQALTVDPSNGAALALVPRLKEAASSAGLLLPPTIAAAVTVAASQGGLPVAVAGEPVTTAPPVAATLVRRGAALDPSAESQSRRKPTLPPAAAAVAIGVLAAGLVWFMAYDVEPETAPAAVEAVSPSVPAAPGPSAPNPAPPRAASPAPAPMREPEPRAAGAAAVNAALERGLAETTAIYRRGDLAGALSRIEPLVDTTSEDGRVGELASTLAQAAARSMMTAAAAADVLRAAERAPETYRAAAAARARAEQALARRQYVDAGRVALVATEGFRQAQIEAKTAALAPPIPPAASQPESRVDAARMPPPATPDAPGPGGASTTGTSAAVIMPSPGTPVSAPTEVPRPIEAADGGSAAPATVPPATAPVDEAGIFTLLDKYREAHQDVSVDKLLEIFPRMLREDQQSLRKQFKNFRECQVQFLNPDVRPSRSDPTAATVFARTNYTCRPTTNQAPQSYSLNNIFQVRKIGNVWLIQSMGSLDDGVR